MNRNTLKWLNFTLTIIALFAIYVFLDGIIDPSMQSLLIVGLLIVGMVSLVLVLRRENENGR
ncbi:hypothetical protein ACFOLA_03965 [Salinicoccus hispanicus]|uniref:Uncharacterized protein n=1 Tax=Salinicoccus hispanicus TaxID=157225 RepID=A0A6N8U1L5_9STAP|nr:hypothetical protein [Salinicoccus hispanicus]MXQ51970.1 hypothetical protein [Salinicoccus hispanicus]